MAYDYRTERKQFLQRLKDWLDTPEGESRKKRIDQAHTLEEPKLSIAVDAAWDIAESDFEHLHPEYRMNYGKTAGGAS